jgi:glutathione S-transferase
MEKSVAQFARWSLKTTMSSFATPESPPHADINIEGKEHVRLLTIGISHYNEKARWALDLAVARTNDVNESDDPSSVLHSYSEDAHPPALQTFEALDAHKIAGDRVEGAIPGAKLNKGATPLIVKKDGSVVVESAYIVKKYAPELWYQEGHPGVNTEEIAALNAEIDELIQTFDTGLGNDIRTVVYHNTLVPKYYDALADLCVADTSIIEGIIFRLALKRSPLPKTMRKYMTINDVTCTECENNLRTVFADMSKRLESTPTPGYLVGNKFTAADLTFAALSAPMVRPPEAGNAIPASRLPPRYLKLATEVAETTAGKHVLSMYSKHRGRTVVYNSIGRNRIPPTLMVAGGLLGVGIGMAMV